jgi:hypothetical protein
VTEEIANDGREEKARHWIDIHHNEEVDEDEE